MYIKLRKVFVHTLLNHPVKKLKVLTPFFKIYTYHMLYIISGNMQYVGNLMPIFYCRDWKTLKITLNQVMTSLFRL